jgi:ribosomal protein S6--L-glutamate ligase
MRLVSFNPFRSLDIPGVMPLKPESMFDSEEHLRAADFVLFPEYWQVNALIYGYRKKIFPSASTYHLGHNKIELTRSLRAVCPEQLPLTLILQGNEHNAERIYDEMSLPFVAKEAQSSNGQGVFLIRSRQEWESYVDRNEILYAQEYLPIGRDLRVVLVGDRVVTAYFREAPEGGFKTNVAQGGQMRFDDIPQAAIDLVLRAAKALGVDHAGFDVADCDGAYFIFEFNPFFGTHGLNAKGISLGPIIYDYLKRSL